MSFFETPASIARELRFVRKIARTIRVALKGRRNLSARDISSKLNYFLPQGSQVHISLSSFLPKEVVRRVDTARRAPVRQPFPELEISLYFVVLIFLINQKRYDEAKACALESIARVKNIHNRVGDLLGSKLYFYYSLCYELTGDLAVIRSNLLALHSLATLRHDELCQVTLFNLLLRNYLHYNLYDQAEKFMTLAPPPFGARSTQQFCRYLFYLGKIRTIQLQYTDAKLFFPQAAWLSPVAAVGFRVQCSKWIIIVHLLLGEIPLRSGFMKKGMKRALRPYFELTNAVRIGDLELLRAVAEKFSGTFIADRTNNLIVRLRLSVIRIRLRNISIAYSRISLPDVVKKMGLASTNPIADVENIICKAIRDGAIDAKVDHANGWMVCNGMDDIYSTNAPQIAFHSRIEICLHMHNEAVRALWFRPRVRRRRVILRRRDITAAAKIYLRRIL